MLVKILGAALQGIDAIPITIEVVTDTGFQYVMVGLPDTAVKESAESARRGAKPAYVSYKAQRGIRPPAGSLPFAVSRTGS